MFRRSHRRPYFHIFKRTLLCVQLYHDFLGSEAALIQSTEVKVNVLSAVFGCKVIESRKPCLESSLMTLVCTLFCLSETGRD